MCYRCVLFGSVPHDLLISLLCPIVVFYDGLSPFAIKASFMRVTATLICVCKDEFLSVLRNYACLVK